MLGLWALTDELPLGPAVRTAEGGVLAEVALAVALPAACDVLPPDLAMSTAEAGTEEFAPAAPDALAEPVACGAMAPFVPSTLMGEFGSEAPSSTSGSTKSADANSVGINPESEGAPGGGVLKVGEVETDEAGAASGPKSSSTPCASKSSSESIGPIDGAVGGAAAVVAGTAADEDGRPPPGCDVVPFNPNGSSTGRSAKGSKAGREAASIVFEPEIGRPILKRILQCRCRGT
jgi:hypothetical protein